MRPVALIAAGLLATVGQSAAGAPVDTRHCPATPFPLHAPARATNPWAEPDAIRRLAQADEAVPPEIARIADGAVSHFVGGAINDGLVTWYAYDAARRLFIAVLGHAGPQLASVPAAADLGRNQFVRMTRAAGYPRSEFVTVVAASTRRQFEFACLANRLLATPAQTRGPRMRSDTLVDNTEIRRGGLVVNDGGGGPARWQLDDALQELIATDLRAPIARAWRR